MVDGAGEFDDLLDLCSDRHRRIILAELTGRQRTRTIRDLAEAIVKHDHHQDGETAPEETVREIQLSLHHRHLPKLEAGGFVEYDPERRRVEPTERVVKQEAAISSIIDQDPSLEIPFEE